MDVNAEEEPVFYEWEWLELTCKKIKQFSSHQMGNGRIRTMIFCGQSIYLLQTSISLLGKAVLLPNLLKQTKLSHCMTKPTKWHVPPAKTDQPGHRPVISESLLCAQWVAKDPTYLHVDSKDWSDWADAQSDLSLRWAHRSFCWFCHTAAQLPIFSLQTILYLLDIFIAFWSLRLVSYRIAMPDF